MASVVTGFVSQFFDENQDMLFLENDSWKKAIESVPSKQKYLKNFCGVFDFDRYPDINDKYIYSDYFSQDESGKYDLIVAELPFGLKYVDNKHFGLLILENWEMIYTLLGHLKDEGTLLVGTEPNFGTTAKSRKFIQALKDEDFYLSALIEAPKNILMPLTILQPNIAVFTKQDPDQLFVASLDDNEHPEIVFNNYINRTSGEILPQGVFIDPDDFKGFYDFRAVKKIKNLLVQCKEFKKHFLTELSSDINTTDTTFTETEGEYLYISRKNNCNVFSSIHNLDSKHNNYYQIKVNKELAISEYLEKYFASEVGRMSLKSQHYDDSLSRITMKDIEELVVPLPPVDTQKEIVFSYSLMDKVHSVINRLEQDLSLNPKNAKVIIEKLTDTLTTLNQLSKADKVRFHIRQGEDLNTEYKQTFSTDLRTGKKEKYIQDAALKNIAGFLNKEGGALLIGVTDEGEIYGIENDSYQSDDKYLLYFKDKVKTAIGKEFYDLIKYEIVDVDDSKVLFVECKGSKKPVYLYGKDFYVRTNPATDKLEGPKLVEYINSHF